MKNPNDPDYDGTDQNPGGSVNGDDGGTPAHDPAADAASVRDQIIRFYREKLGRDPSDDELRTDIETAGRHGLNEVVNGITARASNAPNQSGAGGAGSGSSGSAGASGAGGYGGGFSGGGGFFDQGNPFDFNFQPFNDQFNAPSKPANYGNQWQTQFNAPRVVTNPDGTQSVMRGNYLQDFTGASLGQVGGQQQGFLPGEPNPNSGLGQVGQQGAPGSFYPRYQMPSMNNDQKAAYNAAKQAGFSDYAIQRFMANNGGPEDLLRWQSALSQDQDPYFGGHANANTERLVNSTADRGNTPEQEAFIRTLNTHGALNAGSGFDSHFRPGETNDQFAARLSQFQATGHDTPASPATGQPLIWTSSPNEGVAPGDPAAPPQMWTSSPNEGVMSDPNMGANPSSQPGLGNIGMPGGNMANPPRLDGGQRTGADMDPTSWMTADQRTAYYQAHPSTNPRDLNYAGGSSNFDETTGQYTGPLQMVNTGGQQPGGADMDPTSWMTADQRAAYYAAHPSPDPRSGVTATQMPTTGGQQPAPSANGMQTTSLESADPGYDFRMNEGMKALQRSAAAKGSLLTGGTAKAMTQYGQDYGSNEYDKIYNRSLGEYGLNYDIFNNEQNRASTNYSQDYSHAMQEYLNKYNISRQNQLDQYGIGRNNTLDAFNMSNANRQLSDAEQLQAFDIYNTLDNNYFNRLFQLGNLGVSAAGSQAGAGNNISDLMTQIGNAIAAGRVGSGNAYAGGLGNIGNQWANIYAAQRK